MLQADLSINKNHTLHYAPAFNGLPVMSAYLPMVAEMLESLWNVASCALTDYPRVFAFRFDLRLPAAVDTEASDFANAVISRFIASLKAKVRHDRARAAKENVQAHDTEVRYFWVREVGDWGRVHYHCTVLLNADAYNWLGRFQSERENMANRVFGAWASALGLTSDQARDLVHFPENPSYQLRRDDPQSVGEWFYRASYLCKVHTKFAGNGHHVYGSSRG